ncbi:chromosome segregation protein SMC [Actinospica robiniae]|uniref:chromosome segregation protein SMC n=1 Tax=Actinospica robiniae TaxID=304901 RepID=UPI000414484B|nr:chromosome segregation protein SMC [Actinospica robiniae]
MHLKSMTLRGFKSFASATTLRFEPGITCVVGPNGSGKSNVVDALAWVMGEQGAKSLRGGKMEDVIFAGTSGRPPLGRAEVSLTIDNTDGALPIDYTEVTISRIMFRNGGSEYAINGTACRLLDIQELLSDSGIGREMHVIVGQGRLDAVLQAGPEERRAFIEEAAGVLKHRKRKEKALRKLDAMQANLTRITDLTTELRRQLKPLGRQAEVARRAVAIQADLRDARLRLLADEFVTLQTAYQQETADDQAVKERRARIEREVASCLAQETELERSVQELVPHLAATQEAWYRLSSLRERLRGTSSLAGERLRNLTQLAQGAQTERHGRDPEEMEREAEYIREQEDTLAEEIAQAQEALADAVRRRGEAEAAHGAEERRLAAAVRSAADRRENLAKLAGRVGAVRSKLAAADAELGRLEAAHEEARGRAASVQHEYDELKAQVEGIEDGDGLDAEVEEATTALAETEERLTALRAAERDAERERGAFAARKEALELGLNRKDGAGALLAATDRLSGMLGSVAAILTIEQGAETAVAAALGLAADAVAVGSPDAAVNAMRLLKAEDKGRAAIVIGGAHYQGAELPELPSYARYLSGLVRVPTEMRASVERLLYGMAIVDDLGEASRLLEARPELVAVTREGDVLGRHIAHGGSSSAPSLLEIQAAVDEAAEKLAEAIERARSLRIDLEQATDQQRAAKQHLDALVAERRAADAQKASVAQQLGRLGGQARAALAEVERYAKAADAAKQAREKDESTLVDLELEHEEAAAAAETSAEGEENSTELRDELAAEATAARAAEMEARLAVRTGEERARSLAGRADGLDRAARAEREARARAAERQAVASEQARVARAVVSGVRQTLACLEISLAQAGALREQAEKERAEREARLSLLRTRGRELAGELDQLTDAAHRDEVARAEKRMRLEQLEEKAMEEHGVAITALVAEYGPEAPVPVVDANGEPGTVKFVRVEQEKRLRQAEKDYTALGKVNPLALEEFAAMEERYKFLSEQLEDLKKTRADLLQVVKDVDERVEQVFAEAYADTEREFVGVFSRLFPGGEGRLYLTDPSDMLTTGIEVEARPPGKKVKRLSLLSGGERSLTAVALLVSIFKARPSPFYVMDEVEAALDDTNLQRLIAIMEELRASSQLIVITHQKRTMEVADALYGVSMRGDGVTTVISQKLRRDGEMHDHVPAQVVSADV